MTVPQRAHAVNVLASPIGRRLVALFAGCALLPLVAFAWLAVSSATRQMRVDLRLALHDGAKTAGMGIAARLSQIHGDLALAEEFLRLHPEPGAEPSPALVAHLQDRCEAVWCVQQGQAWALLGGVGEVGAPSPRDQAHLAAGKPLLRFADDGALLMSARSGDGPCVHARVRRARFFDPEELRAAGAEVAVFAQADGAWRTLYHSFAPGTDLASLRAVVQTQSRHGAMLAWQPAGEPHLASAWSAFLQPQYGRDLLVVQSRAEAEALAISRGFLWWFASAGAVTIGLVLLASLVQMRRTLGPILVLRDATRRLATGDLAVRVALGSRDEFGHLGHAFNDMAAQLQENIARRERTERDLIASRDQALAAAQAKATFVTNVSHELRTPMTEILGAVEILTQMGAEDPAAREEFSHIALHGAQRLARLVDDVLALDAATALQRVPVAVLPTLQAALATFPAPAQQRVQVVANAAASVVDGDADRLRDTWIRLLDNALKFSTDAVTVSVGERDGQVVVEVADRGVGIAAADQAHIFEPFSQVGRDQLIDKASGTGLGLTLAKSTIDRHGGRIEVESEPGRGSTFRVLLPAVVAAPTA